MRLTYGSICSGYGGLDMGVQSVLGGETRWFCENDKAPSKILAHHCEDEVALRVGQEGKLLPAFAEPHSKQPAGTEREQRLG